MNGEEKKQLTKLEHEIEEIKLALKEIRSVIAKVFGKVIEK